MAIDPITQLPPAPQRTDAPDVFVPKANAHVASLDQLVTEFNTSSGQIDDVGDAVTADAAAAAVSETSASNSAASAQNSANISASNANFVGQWSTLTGALNVPASVFHTSDNWQLLNNLADVTLSEPGVSGDWSLIPSATAVDGVGIITGDTGTATSDQPNDTFSITTTGALSSTASAKNIDIALDAQVPLKNVNETIANPWTFGDGLVLPDQKAAEFGNSSDLIIGHDATDSLINNCTGELKIQDDGTDVIRVAPALVEIVGDLVVAGEVTAGGAAVGGMDVLASAIVVAPAGQLDFLNFADSTKYSTYLLYMGDVTNNNTVSSSQIRLKMFTTSVIDTNADFSHVTLSMDNLDTSGSTLAVSGTSTTGVNQLVLMVNLGFPGTDTPVCQGVLQLSGFDENKYISLSSNLTNTVRSDKDHTQILTTNTQLHSTWLQETTNTNGFRLDMTNGLGNFAAGSKFTLLGVRI